MNGLARAAVAVSSGGTVG